MTFARSIRVRGKEIGDGWPCYFVAEIGNNHNGDLETARKLIRAAADAGADAVKFQTFKASDIVSPKVPADAYPGWDVSDRFSTWREFIETWELPYDAYDGLIDEAHAHGLAFISTPASFEALHVLVGKRVDALKIASMDLNNIPLLELAKRSGLPVLLSTGMATLEEIRRSVGTLAGVPLVILHCVSCYPLDYSDANLLNIRMLRDRFTIPTGFSNHALGWDLDLAAVTLGAVLIEKHFTLSRATDRLAEHHFSMEPGEMSEMIARARRIEKALGTYERTFTAAEQQSRELARRSVTVIRDLARGETIRAGDVTLLRPGTGIEPGSLSRVIGRRVLHDLRAYDTLTWADLSPETTECESRS